MAGPFAHFAFTHKAIEKTLLDAQLKESFKPLFADFRNHIITGSISPDMPCFYDKDLRDEGARLWTHRMHSVNTKETVLSGLKYLKSSKENDPNYNHSLSWFLGYVAHMVADIVSHPVVNATVGPYHSSSEDNRAEHRLMEITQGGFIFNDLGGNAVKYIGSVDSEQELEAILESTLPIWEAMLKGGFVNYLDTMPNIEKWQANFKNLLARAEYKPYGFSLYIYHLLEKTSIDNRTESEKKADREKYIDHLPYPKANCLKQEVDPKRPVKYTDIYFRSIDLICDYWINILDDIENDTGWTKNNFQNVSLDTGALIGESSDVPPLMWPH